MFIPSPILSPGIFDKDVLVFANPSLESGGRKLMDGGKELQPRGGMDEGVDVGMFGSFEPPMILQDKPGRGPQLGTKVCCWNGQGGVVGQEPKPKVSWLKSDFFQGPLFGGIQKLSFCIQIPREMERPPKAQETSMKAVGQIPSSALKVSRRENVFSLVFRIHPKFGPTQ